MHGNLNLKLKNPSGTVVAQTTSTTARPESISYAVPAGVTGTYTLEAVAVTDDADFTLSFSYPRANDRVYGYDAGGLPVSETTPTSSNTWQVDGLDRVIRSTAKT